ncbi:MAG: hypothetical protein SaRV1_gp1 [Sanya rhabdovirus 1]|nr:MAG: hypothetical protein SaRV1_gp1 [Sanya rhabdovirus 1]
MVKKTNQTPSKGAIKKTPTSTPKSAPVTPAAPRLQANPQSLTPVSMGANFEAKLQTFGENMMSSPGFGEYEDKPLVVPAFNALDGLETIRELGITGPELFKVWDAIRDDQRELSSGELEVLFKSIKMKRTRSQKWKDIKSRLDHFIQFKDFAKEVEEYLAHQMSLINRRASNNSSILPSDSIVNDSSASQSITVDEFESCYPADKGMEEMIIEADIHDIPDDDEGLADKVFEEAQEENIERTMKELEDKSKQWSAKDNSARLNSAGLDKSKSDAVTIEVPDSLSNQFEKLDLNAVHNIKCTAEASGSANITDGVPPVEDEQDDFFSTAPQDDLDTILRMPVSRLFLHQDPHARDYVVRMIESSSMHSVCCEKTDKKSLNHQLNSLIQEFRIDRVNLEDDYTFVVAVSSELGRVGGRYLQGNPNGELIVKVTIVCMIKCFLWIASYLRSHPITRLEFIATHYAIIKLMYRANPIVARHIAEQVISPHDDQNHFMIMLMFNSLNCKSIILMSGYSLMLKSSCMIHIEMINSILNANLNTTSNIVEKVERVNSYSQSMMCQIFNMITSFNTTSNAIHKLVKSFEATTNMAAGTSTRTTHDIPSHIQKAPSTASTSKSGFQSTAMYLNSKLKVGYWMGVPLAVDDKNSFQVSVDATAYLRGLGGSNLTHDAIRFIAKLSGNELVFFGRLNAAETYPTFWEMFDAFDIYSEKPSKLMKSFFQILKTECNVTNTDTSKCFDPVWELIPLPEFIRRQQK